jgi:hypothetical protein
MLFLIHIHKIKKWGEGFGKVVAEPRWLQYLHLGKQRRYLGFLETGVCVATSPPSHFTTILCFYAVKYSTLKKGVLLLQISVLSPNPCMPKKTKIS